MYNTYDKTLYPASDILVHICYHLMPTFRIALYFYFPLLELLHRDIDTHIRKAYLLDTIVS